MPQYTVEGARTLPSRSTGTGRMRATPSPFTRSSVRHAQLGAEHQQGEVVARDVEDVGGARLGLGQGRVELGDVLVGELEDVAVADGVATPLARLLERHQRRRVDRQVVVGGGHGCLRRARARGAGRGAASDRHGSGSAGSRVSGVSDCRRSPNAGGRTAARPGGRHRRTGRGGPRQRVERRAAEELAHAGGLHDRHEHRGGADGGGASTDGCMPPEVSVCPSCVPTSDTRLTVPARFGPPVSEAMPQAAPAPAAVVTARTDAMARFRLAPSDRSGPSATRSS